MFDFLYETLRGLFSSKEETEKDIDIKKFIINSIRQLIGLPLWILGFLTWLNQTWVGIAMFVASVLILPSLKTFYYFFPLVSLMLIGIGALFEDYEWVLIGIFATMSFLIPLLDHLFLKKMLARLSWSWRANAVIVLLSGAFLFFDREDFFFSDREDSFFYDGEDSFFSEEVGESIIDEIDQYDPTGLD